MSKPKIPKGWRLLRKGEIIRADCKFWYWNKGPWTPWDDFEQVYIPADLTFLKRSHWPVIRKRNPATGTGAQGKGAKS